MVTIAATRAMANMARTMARARTKTVMATMAATRTRTRTVIVTMAATRAMAKMTRTKTRTMLATMAATMTMAVHNGHFPHLAADIARQQCLSPLAPGPIGLTRSPIRIRLLWYTAFNSPMLPRSPRQSSRLKGSRGACETMRYTAFNGLVSMISSSSRHA